MMHQSEQKFQDLHEMLQEGVWMIDQDACTTYVNQPMAGMLGYTVDDMQGKHLFTFMDGNQCLFY